MGTKLAPTQAMQTKTTKEEKHIPDWRNTFRSISFEERLDFRDSLWPLLSLASVPAG